MATNTVLVLGSSALKIGEAGEFDYSGSQTLKALSEEGLRTVLVNPNIATVQTSEHMAERIYLLPVTPEFVEKVIEKEKPDAIVLGSGGQTALNCGAALHRQGILEKHGVRVLGTPVESILISEDRKMFADLLKENDLPVPRSIAAHSTDEALEAAAKIGFPCMARIAFALGGLGS
ncbi:MAG: carbamoyl phosphate synthase large subunit, partial [bacterium]|nr:carbamoyl phosphate synthase large subunit [bacterium]